MNVKNSALEVPEPEFRHLAALARMSKAFVVELASELCASSLCVGFLTGRWLSDIGFLVSCHFTISP
jgi:hypothetical protein